MYFNVYDDFTHFSVMIIPTKRFMILHLILNFLLIIVPIGVINQIFLIHLIIMFLVLSLLFLQI